MHHLYPTRIDVNSARGSDPFAESNDYQTDDWYRLDQIIHYIPSQYIDEYSEDENASYIFEPREDHKGNAARACFYFYTMYKEQADEADPDFFDIQKDVLFDWHHLDPVDELEIERTYEIAEYQEGKPNPFVIDTSLVARAYFPETISIAKKNFTAMPKKITLNQNYPNPFNPQTTINFELPTKSYIKLQIYDIYGKLIKTLVNSQKTEGYYSVIWDGRNEKGNFVESGVYLYQLKNSENTKTKAMTLLK